VKGYIKIDPERCKGCQVCIAFCPKELIASSSKLNTAGYIPAVFDSNGECTACTACALVCPEVAIEVYRD